MGERLGQIIVGKHWGEPLTHELFAAVPGDILGGVIDRGEPTIRVQRHDRVGSGLDEMAVASLGARERVLGTFRIGDVSKGGDRADQFALYAERSARYRDIPLFAGGMVDDFGFIALWLAGENAVFAGSDMRPFGRRHRVGDRLADDVGHFPSQQVGPGVIGREHPAIHPGDDNGVR